MTKTLLLPCAIIASGKSTLAKELLRIYGADVFCHIQSDDIKAKRPAPIFVKTVIEAFQKHDCVYADKNNHLLQHRLIISVEFKQLYPNGRIVALDWDLKGLSRDEVINIAAERVSVRFAHEVFLTDSGENHQTLTPLKTPDFKRIISRFVNEKVPIDPGMNQVFSNFNCYF
jgi:tRNA ligase